MSETGPLLETRSLLRAVMLGGLVFLVFVLAAGLLWLAGVALGLGTISAFFIGACAGPLLVLGVLAIWMASMPLERRQKVLGIGPRQSSIDGSESVE